MLFVLFNFLDQFLDGLFTCYIGLDTEIRDEKVQNRTE